MSAIERFLVIAQAYQEATGLKETALSWRLFGDSKKLRRLHSGFDIQVTRYEKALQWLSDHWPEPADWPADVPRPAKGPAPSNLGAAANHVAREASAA